MKQIGCPILCCISIVHMDVFQSRARRGDCEKLRLIKEIAMPSATLCTIEIWYENASRSFAETNLLRLVSDNVLIMSFLTLVRSLQNLYPISIFFANIQPTICYIIFFVNKLSSFGFVRKIVFRSFFKSKLRCIISVCTISFDTFEQFLNCQFLPWGW